MQGGRSVWLLGAPLIAASSVVAHALAYRLAGGDAGIVPDHTHHYLAHLPILAAPAIALLLLALTLRGVRTRRGDASPPLPWTPFALAPPLGFALQEHVERAVQHGAQSPVQEPTFALGVVLAVPLGLAAFLGARALLTSADRAALAPALPSTWLSPPPTVATAETTSSRPAATLAVRRPTGRGPPGRLAV